MIQRPASWVLLIGLTALAVAAPFVFRKKTPGREREPVAPASNMPSNSTSAAASDAHAPDAEVPRPRPPWPASAKLVLHVGDSTLGFEQGLALEMATRFKAIGVRYEAVTEASAGLRSFATSGKLAELVRAKKPDMVLLTLGMNNLTVAAPDEYEPDVKYLVAQIGDRPCWWIGPLSIERPETGLIAILGRATAPCGWSNSYELDIERQPDHIHPTQRGASRWADANWTALGAPLPEAGP
jgi:acyl-CoA thioesterase-1